MRPTCRDSAAGTIVRRATPALDTEHVNLGTGDKLHDWNPAGQHGSKDARFLANHHEGISPCPLNLFDVIELGMVVPAHCDREGNMLVHIAARTDASGYPVIGILWRYNANQ